MYGEQFRSVIPCASQAPRKRTTWTSTKSTSSKSIAIFDPLSLICFSSSAKCSACIRPMSRMVVLVPSEYFSIFKVIFDLPDDSRLTEGNHSATRNQLIYWCLAFEIRPQFWRLLKIQHRLCVWLTQNPVDSGQSTKARYIRLRGKSWSGFLFEVRPEGQ